jgi:hypothetical protein
MEQPKYAKILNKIPFVNKNFDLLATYSQSLIYPGSSVPNLPLSYYPLQVYPAEAVLSPPPKFKDKDGYGTGI